MCANQVFCKVVAIRAMPISFAHNEHEIILEEVPADEHERRAEECGREVAQVNSCPCSEL